MWPGPVHLLVVLVILPTLLQPPWPSVALLVHQAQPGLPMLLPRVSLEHWTLRHDSLAILLSLLSPGAPCISFRAIIMREFTHSLACLFLVALRGRDHSGGTWPEE